MFMCIKLYQSPNKGDIKIYKNFFLVLSSCDKQHACNYYSMQGFTRIYR